MTRALRQIPTLLTAFGAALPIASKDHRGQFVWKRAHGAADEIYAGVVDASNDAQFSRVLTEDYGDTLYPSSTVVVTRGIKRDCVPDPNATTWQTALLGAPTVTAASTANADTSLGPYVQLLTSTSSGNVAKFVLGTGGNPRGDWELDLQLNPRTYTSISNVRLWVGMFSSTPEGAASPSGISGCGFRFDTGAGDTTWQAWSNDLTSTGTFTDTGISGATGSSYRMRIVWDSSANISFYITDNLVATHTTNLPDAATYHPVGYYCTTLTTAATGLRVGRTTLIHER